MIKIINPAFFLLFLYSYTIDAFAYNEITLDVNNFNSISYYNGKDIETLTITSTKQPDYCILISSSQGIPFTKGKIYFNEPIELLKKALKNAYLNPASKWWSIELYHDNDFNHPYAILPITPNKECDNGGLNFEIIEHHPPYYFVSIKLNDKTNYRFGFIKSEIELNEKDFDFTLLDEVYMKNNNKYTLLSCDETNFDCSIAKYAYPYQFFK